jgi:acetoacetyl-CoA synthetase
MSAPAAPELLWQPSPEFVENARLTEYMGWLERERGLHFAGYEELWQWSVDDLDAFWASLWDFFEVQADGDPAPVLASREMPVAERFTNS